jgi:hypothetical protein
VGVCVEGMVVVNLQSLVNTRLAGSSFLHQLKKLHILVALVPAERTYYLYTVLYTGHMKNRNLNKYFLSVLSLN